GYIGNQIDHNKQEQVAEEPPAYREAMVLRQKGSTRCNLHRMSFLSRQLRTSGGSALRELQLRSDLLSNGTSHTMHFDEPDQAVHLRRRARQAPRSSAPSQP